VVAAIHKIVHGWYDLPAGGDTNNNNHSAKSPLPMSEHSTWKFCEHPYVGLAALHSQCLLQAVATHIFIHSSEKPRLSQYYLYIVESVSMT